METNRRLTSMQQQQLISDPDTEQLDLRDVNLNNMLLSRGSSTFIASAWMESFFQSVGDVMPNLGEIHFEKTERRAIYNCMVTELTDSSCHIKFLSYGRFCRLWKEQFSHVKIREFKAVTGKCHYCAILSEIRCSTKKREVRQRVSDYQALHRVTYMGERKLYYSKLLRSLSESANYISIIIDGMAQSHSKLPYLGNKKNVPSSDFFEVELRCIEHGENFAMYRTFGNVQEDTNLNITCILMQLESQIKKFCKLPPTLCIQVDGGSENANKYVIGICELIVARRLTNRSFLTRLPVGHTHKDIDRKLVNCGYT